MADHNDITRLAYKWSSRADEMSTNDPVSRAHAMVMRNCAAELRTLAQQGKAGGVAEGYVLVPRTLTAENGAKQKFMGEQFEGRDIPWTSVKAVHKAVVRWAETLFSPPAHPPEAGVTALIEFARWAISESSFQGCDLDGGGIQDKATELGLLKEVQITEPCSEGGCACADAGADFPTTCYRFAAALAPQPKDAPPKKPEGASNG